MQAALRVLVPALIGLAVVLGSLPAEAGRLGKVSRGIGRASGAGRGGGDGGGGGSGHAGGGSRPGGHGSGPTWSHYTVGHGQPGHHHHDWVWRPGIIGATTAPVSFDAYMGAQKVVESDGSYTFEGALTAGRLRLGGTLTNYFEKQGPAGSSAPMLYVNVGALTAGWRMTGDGATRVYAEAGLAAVATIDDPVADSRVYGVTTGLRMEHRLAAKFALLGEARVYRLQNDIRARELRVGAHVSVLRVSYRVLDFNVGPALHGPELGIGVRF